MTFKLNGRVLGLRSLCFTRSTVLWFILAALYWLNQKKTTTSQLLNMTVNCRQGRKASTKQTVLLRRYLFFFLQTLFFFIVILTRVFNFYYHNLASSNHTIPVSQKNAGHYWPTSKTPFKRHLNGVSLAGRLLSETYAGWDNIIKLTKNLH